MRVREHLPLLLLSATLAAVAAACGRDGGVGPRFLDGRSKDTVVTVFQIGTGTNASFGIAGTHKITFPAKSICDPEKSSYGVDQWQHPCVPAKGVVIVTSRSWYDSAGHPQVDFAPRMRFDPSADPVVLYLKDRHDLYDGFSILYCPDGGACYDESETDSTLVTYRDPHNGNFYRRIRHFSGYNIASGRAAVSRPAPE